MEIKTIQVDDKPLTIIIQYPILDAKTKTLIKKIESLDFMISGNSKAKVFQLHISDIYCMESVERKTFLYTKDEIYMTDKKLYELEEMLRNTGIIRISKSCLMNMDMLYSIRQLMFFCGCLTLYCIFSKRFKEEYNKLFPIKYLP